MEFLTKLEGMFNQDQTIRETLGKLGRRMADLRLL